MKIKVDEIVRSRRRTIGQVLFKKRFWIQSKQTHLQKKRVQIRPEDFGDPKLYIDYVVVHEFVHLEERNHSRAFWTKVERLYPAYKSHSAWLKDNHHLLGIL